MFLLLQGLINYNTVMTTERSNSAGKFCIQKQQTKAPFHLHHRRKVSQLESKIHFFEGQVDPLHLENSSLKQQLVSITRMSSLSSDILRVLLPTSGDPTKKLKVQLSNLLELSQMVRDDWQLMKEITKKNMDIIYQLTLDRNQCKKQFEDETVLRLVQVEQLQNKIKELQDRWKGAIAAREEMRVEMVAVHQAEKEEIRAHYDRKLKLYESGILEYQNYRQETRQKQNQYQKTIERLNGDLSANFTAFEESKKHLKEIYDKIMSEKLAEQAEGYDLVVKMKQEEKMGLKLMISEQQEEHKRQLAFKDYEIAKLNDIKINQVADIEALKEQIWNKELTIDKQLTSEKLMNEKLITANSFNQTLLLKIDQKSKEFDSHKKELQTKLKKLQKQMDMTKKESNAALLKAIEDRDKLQKAFCELQDNYKDVNKALSKGQAQFNLRVKRLKDQWSLREEQLSNLLTQNQLELEKQTHLLNLSKLQLQQLIQSHERIIKTLNADFKQKQARLINKYENKIISIGIQAEQQRQQLQKIHERQMKQAVIASNQQLRQSLVNFNMKIASQAQQFTIKMDQMKKQEQRAIRMYRELEQQVEGKMQNIRDEAEVSRIRLLGQLNKLQRGMESERERMQAQMGDQLLLFQQSLDQKEKQMSKLKQMMEQQIKILKQANGLDSVEAKFKAQIKRLKAQFAQQQRRQEQIFKQEMQAKQKSKKELMQNLILNHKHQMTDLKNSYDDNLSRIAQQTQQNQNDLNNKLLGGMSDQMEGRSNQQKKQYIVNKINDLKHQVNQKDNQITALLQSLRQIETNIEMRVKAKRQQLEIEKEIAVRSCNEKVARTTAECKARVQEVQASRIEHALAMQQEFIKMRKMHEEQYGHLQQKYQQLERLFDERPSRMEDLSKIKELMNIQSKRDMEIQTYNKKMETANQIVKYLNLQLQNYKDAYDIFKPQSEGKEMGLAGHGFSRSPQTKKNSETQQLMEAVKARNNQRSESEKVEEKLSQRESLSFRKWADSPAVKDLKLLNEQGQNVQMQPQMKPINQKQRHFSNLIPKSPPPKRERIKTQKSEKGDNEGQIVANANNFLKLLKGGQSNGIVITEESESGQKRSYRKRKVNKKHTIAGSNF